MAMKCPHCGVTIPHIWTAQGNRPDQDGQKLILNLACVDCGRTIYVMSSKNPQGSDLRTWKLEDDHITLLYPRATNRGPVPAEVPKPYEQYYQEAALVLADSPMASAALSRRLLQLILRDEANVKPGKLVNEIDQALSSLPPYLQDLHDLRDVANFAAHPNKNDNTGEIIDVEPGEAEWLLDILDKLFGFYFVEPEVAKKRKADWEARKSPK